MTRSAIGSLGGGVVVAVLVAGLATSAVPEGASAFWSTGSTSPSSGAASAATVNPATKPVVTVSTQNDITVDWDPSTLSNGTAVSGYVVTRYDQSGVAQSTTGGCAGTLTASVCTENDVADGLWTYAVTPRFGVNWVGETSPRSDQIRADATPPVNNITHVVGTGGSAQQGSSTTFFYRGSIAGSLRLSNALTDVGGSGPASSVTGQLAGTTTGWSHSASSVSTPTGGPFESGVFSWAAGTTSEPTVGVAGLDNAGNTAGSTVQFRLDNASPTGGAIGYPNGFVTASSITVTLDPVTDPLSGVGSRTLQRATAPLTNNACGAFTAFANAATIAESATVVNSGQPVVNNTCYQYRYVVTDRVGNTSTVSSANTVKVRDYATSINTADLVSHWRLADTAGTTIAAAKGAAGTWFGGPTLSQTGAIAGDPNTAVSFDGVDDYGRVARTVSGNFSIEFWFRSTQGSGAGTQWYNGAGLVDGEVAGVANDFGVSLLANGQVAAGVGNPDRTVLSTAGLNNDVWHHVVMTRTQSSGVVQLYVDGVSQGTVIGNTAALTASADLSFGRLATGIQYYRGFLDEIALYSAALPAATVLSHYQSGRP